MNSLDEKPAKLWYKLHLKSFESTSHVTSTGAMFKHD